MPTTVQTTRNPRHMSPPMRRLPVDQVCASSRAPRVRKGGICAVGWSERRSTAPSRPSVLLAGQRPTAYPCMPRAALRVTPDRAEPAERPVAGPAHGVPAILERRDDVGAEPVLDHDDAR